MKETGWQAIGRIARERRERLGLKQEQLALYEGPGVSTVGKFERAAQASFPLRTQHQMEKALGWSRGTIEQFVAAFDAGQLDPDDWGHDLILEDVPDLDHEVTGVDRDAADLARAAQTINSVLRYIDRDRLDDAVRATLHAIFPFLSSAGAADLGRDLRTAFPPFGGDGDGQNAEPTILREVDTAIYEDEAAYGDDDDKG